MRVPVRRLYASLIALLPCTACASIATAVNVSRSAQPGSAEVGSTNPNATAVRRVFTVQLVSDRERLAKEPLPIDERTWGTARVVVNDDDSMEYLVTLYNPTGEAFTEAHVHRGEANNGDHGETVATLFADVALRDRYVQLRGTVMVHRDQQGSVLAEELRNNPGEFEVRVHSAKEPAGLIRGRVE